MRAEDNRDWRGIRVSRLWSKGDRTHMVVREVGNGWGEKIRARVGRGGGGRRKKGLDLFVV